MVSFTEKKIEQQQRVCLRLKQLREQAGLSLEDIETKTKISKSYLVALEACDFDALPQGTIYQKSFIRKYLKALGITDPGCYVRQFEREEVDESEEQIVHPATPASTRAVRAFQNIPFLLRGLSVAVVAIVLIGYLVFQVKHTVEPPALTVYSPTNGEITNEKRVTVSGQTGKEVRVSINGEEIVSGNHGEFEQAIDLSPGVNAITITARRRYGKPASETRYITLRDGLIFTLEDTN